MSDQHRADAVGPVARGVETPALNQIAADGMTFTQCFTDSPQCVSARAALLSGLPPGESGIVANGSGFIDPDRDNWFLRFKQAGYHTALFGKAHLTAHGADLRDSVGGLRRIGFETVDELVGPRGHVATGSRLTDLWRAAGLWEIYAADIAERDRNPAQRVRPSPLGLDLYYDTYVGQQTRKFLETYNERRPFFCWMSFPGPHEPYDAPEPYASLYAPEDMPPAIPRPIDLGRGAPCLLHELLSRRCPENPGLTRQEIASLRANYAGNVRLIDDQIGKTLELLCTRGLYDNTIVIFTSDHGEMNGDWGMLRKKVFLDGSVRVPLIVKPHAEFPGPRGLLSHALVQLMDVGATCLGLAGIEECPEKSKSRSLLKVLVEPSSPHREIIRSQFRLDQMILSDRWKLMLNAAGQQSFLFDRQADPDEQSNLVGEIQLSATGLNQTAFPPSDPPPDR